MGIYLGMPETEMCAQTACIQREDCDSSALCRESIVPFAQGSTELLCASASLQTNIVVHARRAVLGISISEGIEEGDVGMGSRFYIQTSWL